MVNTYMTSRLDNGNCLLYGISDHLLTRLQIVLKAGARLIPRTKKRDHITSSNRSSLAYDRMQTANVDVSKPARPSCIILNRPTNSLPADPCATLRGHSPAGGSTMQATYAGRPSILPCYSTPLEQSVACHACHRLPQFVQKATEDITVYKSVLSLK